MTEPMTPEREKRLKAAYSVLEPCRDLLTEQGNHEISRHVESARYWMDILIKDLDTLRAQPDVRYEELIMAVETKHEGETRHQTALRYIQTMEAPTFLVSKTALDTLRAAKAEGRTT